MGLFKKKKKVLKEMVIKASNFSYKINGNMDTDGVIRRIKFKDDPFKEDLNIRFAPYEYDGEKAMEIYINEELVGEVPGYQIPKIEEYLDNPCVIAEHVVYGGTNGMPYGISLTLRFMEK